ncbi:MAG: polysaccharide pyruvyl transferase family protein [Verrucomicrobiales bacterium]|nr:polysaccharide pyruvyl transferase family protein [Verrucomicrobiales bacterium]
MIAPSDKVCLMGASLGTGNRGVSALGASLIHLVSSTTPGAEPVLVIGSRSPGPFEAIAQGRRTPVTTINHRLSPKSPPGKQILLIALLAVLHRILPGKGLKRWLASTNEWVNTVANARFVGEICGGDSFSDIYGFQRFFFRSLPTILVILIRGEIVLFPQTYGPFKTRIAQGIAGWIVRRASMALARDKVSLEVARSLGATPDRSKFCPDVAFTLPIERPENPAIEPPLPPATGARCLVGLNVSGLLFHGGYSRANMFDLKMDYPAFVRGLVERLLQSPENRVLLVPHTFAPPGRVESDNGACAELRAALPAALQERVHLVTHGYDQHQIKGVIGMCDFFIGSRMHACIAALSQGIPTIGVAYSRKFVGVFESVGVASWVVDGKSTTGPEAIDQILALLSQRETVKADLKRGVDAAKQLVQSTFAGLSKDVASNARRR